jgi:hypothetical protein
VKSAQGQGCHPKRVRGVGKEAVAGHADSWSLECPQVWEGERERRLCQLVCSPTHAVMTCKQAHIREPS